MPKVGLICHICQKDGGKYSINQKQHSMAIQFTCSQCQINKAEQKQKEQHDNEIKMKQDLLKELDSDKVKFVDKYYEMQEHIKRLSEQMQEMTDDISDLENKLCDSDHATWYSRQMYPPKYKNMC